LTRRGDYAVRAALCLARRGGDGGYVKIREVAAAMALPASYTPQVLRLLAEAGLAEARAGRDGGYRLARPSDQVALLEVVEAAEGAFRLERCILRGGPCHWEQACAVHAAWSAAVQAWPWYPALLIGGLFLGLGGASFAVGVPFVNAWFPPERRGFALGVYGMGNIGTAISGFVSPRVANSMGRPWAFLIVAFLLALVGLAFLVLGRDAPTGPGPPSRS